MSIYENILILDDFNSTMSEEAMKEFYQLYEFENNQRVIKCW